jgi:glycosyltransferase involved in cell wall biosynthesis
LLYLLPGVVGGTETYAQGLCGGLSKIAAPDERFVVFVNREAAAWPVPTGFQRIVCPVAATNRAARYAFEQLRLPGLARGHRVDLLHSPGYVGPLRAPMPTVVTVPDLNYLALRDSIPLIRRLALTFFVSRSARAADHVLTISEFGRRELLREYGLAPDRVTATPLAASHEKPAATARPPVEPGYIVAFSSRSPHKNIPRLIEGLRLARARSGVRQRLVIVGHRPPGRPAGEDWVDYRGFVGSAQRDAIVAGADLLAFPSLYEGFGLPILEAMALGVPVVASNRSSNPEVAGDAALYFDPESVDDIAEKLTLVAGDPDLRGALAQAGIRNAARFSWSKTASLTLDVYRRVLETARGR